MIDSTKLKQTRYLILYYCSQLVGTVLATSSSSSHQIGLSPLEADPVLDKTMLHLLVSKEDRRRGVAVLGVEHRRRA